MGREGEFGLGARGGEYSSRRYRMKWARFRREIWAAMHWRRRRGYGLEQLMEGNGDCLNAKARRVSDLGGWFR